MIRANSCIARIVSQHKISGPSNAHWQKHQYDARHNSDGSPSHSKKRECAKMLCDPSDSCSNSEPALHHWVVDQAPCKNQEKNKELERNENNGSRGKKKIDRK